MQKITLYDSEWKVGKIDELVKSGIFKNREEVYRTGSQIVISKKDAQQFSELNLLELDLFENDVKLCLKALQNKKYELVFEKLIQLSKALKLRTMMNLLLENSSEKDFLINTASAIEDYANVIKRFEKYDVKTKKRILNDIKRDMSAIQLYLEQLDDARQKEIKEQTEESNQFQMFEGLWSGLTAIHHAKIYRSYDQTKKEFLKIHKKKRLVTYSGF